MSYPCRPVAFEVTHIRTQRVRRFTVQADVDATRRAATRYADRCDNDHGACVTTTRAVWED